MKMLEPAVVPSVNVTYSVEYPGCVPDLLVVYQKEEAATGRRRYLTRTPLLLHQWTAATAEPELHLLTNVDVE